MSNISLTRSQLEIARKKIKRHYDLGRTVTDQEVYAELTNLQRKNGDFDDLDLQLHSTLRTGAHPIKLD